MKIALLPGGFKPPHLGHYNMAKYLADFADKVIVRIGQKEREGIGAPLALEVWNFYKEFDPDPKAKKLIISVAQSPSPVKDVYDFVELTAPQGSTVILGLGEKDATDGRYNNIPKFAEPRNIKADIELVPPQAGGISGTRMREIIKSNNKKEFFKYIPEFLPEEIKEELWTKLVDSTMPTEVDEMMAGTMNREEMAKHNANMKKLRKQLNKTTDQMVQVPTNLTRSLKRSLYTEASAFTWGAINQIFKKTIDQRLYNDGNETIWLKPFDTKEGFEARRKMIFNRIRKKGGHGGVYHYDIDNIYDDIWHELKDLPFNYRGPIHKRIYTDETHEKFRQIIYNNLKISENFPPYKAKQVQQTRYKASDVFTNDINKAKKLGYLEDGSVDEGDTYEKMAAKGKKAGNLKQGTVRKRLNIPKGEKIPLLLINKELSRLKKMEKRSAKNQKYYKALTLAKTLKTTTHKENIDPEAQKKHKGKSAPYGSAYEPVKEGDPKVGTGKKPKGSGRRLYTDENPRDTVKVKFSTRQDIVDTLSKKSFKSKSHARQSQIINLIHQRVRAALSRAKDPAVKKRLRSAFEYIKKRKEASKRKTQRMRKEGLFSKEWWLDIITEEILNEGGAAGHMAHPFDLPNVKTGKDLIKSFEQAANSLKKTPGSVKIDGVNASIRLINLDGKREFAMDRGSKKALDLRGVTKADLEDRFGAGHGMIKAGGDVLDVFNMALPSIQEELKALGLLDDPNIMFNMEYVSGKSNVQDYGKNFLAIHGLLKVETKEVQGARKILTKRVTTEKPFAQSDMDELLKKLEPFAKKKGFEIYGSVPTTFTKEPDFTSVLNKKYAIDTAEGTVTKTLVQWLDGVTNIPKTDRLKMSIEETDSIKDVGALSKQVYFAVFGGENVDSLFSSEQEVNKAIQGATTYLATEKLGDAILDVLDSPMGSVNDHEGVVIRDDKISPRPFKITGKFITGGVSSDFQKK